MPLDSLIRDIMMKSSIGTFNGQRAQLLTEVEYKQGEKKKRKKKERKRKKKERKKEETN